MTLDDQIQAYLDGTATKADMQAVAAALRDDPAAAHLLARHTLLRELLEDEYAGDYLLPAEPLPAPTAAATHRPIRSGWLPQFAGTVALLLLIGLAGAVWRLTILPDTPPAATVAIVAAASPDVRWREPAPDLPALARGTSLPAGSLAIAAGRLSLLLASGVELTLDGPARFDLCTDMHVQLHTGKLSAVVPEPARGFLVEAQGLRVVDLGTEFEVVAPPSGQPEVAVLRGSVEASFINADPVASPLRINEAERHRFHPAAHTSESLGTAARPASPRDSEVAAERQASGRANALATVGTESQRPVETPTTAHRLDLGGPGNAQHITVIPGGSVSVNRLHATGKTRLHVAGGMFTLADARDDANVCLTAGTELELIVSDGYLTCEKVVRWAAQAETEVVMELAGGLVEARRAFVLSERGRGSLLQTGGQFRIQTNLFINSQDPAQATRYTIRGGQLLGSGTLRLGDWRANDGIFRIEGTQPEIHIGGLAVASDRAVLEYLLDEQGVSPFVADRHVMLGDRGTLRLIARPGAATLPSQVVLMRYSRRQGQFARVELDGLQGEVVYDDEAGEVRLEQIKP